MLCLIHIYSSYHLPRACCCPTHSSCGLLWILLLPLNMHLNIFFESDLSPAIKTSLILIEFLFFRIITERSTRECWNASCKRSYLSSCWTIKMKSWLRWTRLLMTQVSDMFPFRNEVARELSLQGVALCVLCLCMFMAKIERVGHESIINRGSTHQKMLNRSQ